MTSLQFPSPVVSKLLSACVHIHVPETYERLLDLSERLAPHVFQVGPPSLQPRKRSLTAHPRRETLYWKTTSARD